MAPFIWTESVDDRKFERLFRHHRQHGICQIGSEPASGGDSGQCIRHLLAEWDVYAPIRVEGR
jgi:hypothetical protein